MNHAQSIVLATAERGPCWCRLLDHLLFSTTQQADGDDTMLILLTSFPRSQTVLLLLTCSVNAFLRLQIHVLSLDIRCDVLRKYSIIQVYERSTRSATRRINRVFLFSQSCASSATGLPKNTCTWTCLLHVRDPVLQVGKV